MADFIQMAYRENVPETQGLITNTIEQTSEELSQKIYDGIDFSKFKPNIDTEKALKLLWWVIEGYALSFQKEPIDLANIKNENFLHELIHDMESYLDILRMSFYKEEYL